jgi:glucose/arabinose dehydrogenase
LLDLSDRVINQGEMGLLGLTFDPDLDDNPYIYVNYVQPTGGGRETVIARFTLNADLTSANRGSEKIILRVSQPYTNHKAGDLAFGPDGYLYVPLGDGGSTGDPQNRAQNRKTFLGKILRLNVHTDQAYSVPNDNPFVDDNQYAPEIWSLGWRNPWRISFDKQTGDLWVGDVGQNKAEEIDHEPKNSGGRNYGWRCYEGAAAFNTDGCQNKSQYTFPVAQYEHSSSTCDSVTGGFVYRGQDFPELAGYYFYADYCRGDVYTLNSSEATFTARLIKDTNFNISTFGEDNAGEVYLADIKTGTLYQLTSR